MKNSNGQNIRKTAAAAIAAFTMALATSCGQIEDTAGSTPAAAPAPAATEAVTEAPAETAAAEIEAPAETSAEAEETKAEESKPDEKTDGSKAEKEKKTDSSKADGNKSSNSGSTSQSSTKNNTQNSTKNNTQNNTQNNTNTTSNDTQNTAPKAEENAPAPRVAEPVDMTVDRMVNSSVRELCELSANDFEVDYHNIYGVQGISLGIKCASFPNYVFVANHDWVEGTPENEFEIADPNDPTCKFVIGNEIKLLNLMPGAVIDGGITVGMTYNELESALGQDLLVYGTNDTRGFCAEALIKGREWSFVFDLTEEQEQEIQRRQQEMARGEELSIENSRGYAVDISDMNPTSKVAVLYVSY